jgi:serine/threonine protein kinase
MGSVWYAEHLSLSSAVAVKLLEPSIAADLHSLQRFHHEARAAAALRSPHVVQIFDHGVDQGTPYIVMELLEGETLADRLCRSTVLSPSQAGWIVTHIARALSRAHAAGIVHRDLKPSNVFIVQNDDKELAKLLDFGVAKSLNETDLGQVDNATRPGALVGTPYYVSPEQAHGDTTLDHRADIWALGVIAFECLLGRHPFEAQTLGSLLLQICTRPMPVPSSFGKVPAGFDAWFARACARDVGQRFDTAKQAATELRRACEEAEARDPLAHSGSRTLASPQFSNLGRDFAIAEGTERRHSVFGAGRPIWARLPIALVGLLALLAAGALLFRRNAPTAELTSPSLSTLGSATREKTDEARAEAARLVPEALPTARDPSAGTAPTIDLSDAGLAAAAPEARSLHKKTPAQRTRMTPPHAPPVANIGKPPIDLGI